MEPLKLLETSAGSFSLTLNADATPSDVVALVDELGHAPNGYFWDGVAKTAVRVSAPDLEDEFDLDSEAGMFCAYGANREALVRLGALLAPLATRPGPLRELLEQADPSDFDD